MAKQIVPNRLHNSPAWKASFPVTESDCEIMIKFNPDKNSVISPLSLSRYSRHIPITFPIIIIPIKYNNIPSGSWTY